MRNTLPLNQQLASSESFRHLQWSLSDTFAFLSKNFKTSDFEQIESNITALEREILFRVYLFYFLPFFSFEA